MGGGEAAAADAEDKNIEIWKIKKLIKSLEAARGCDANPPAARPPAAPRARGAPSAARPPHSTRLSVRRTPAHLARASRTATARA